MCALLAVKMCLSSCASYSRWKPLKIVDAFIVNLNLLQRTMFRNWRGTNGIYTKKLIQCTVAYTSMSHEMKR